MFKKMAKFILAIMVLALVLFAFHKPIAKQIYKLEYQDIIDKNAEIYNIDKNLVYALVKKESKYDPLAVSKKGAKGLMQIMPETGEYIAKLIGDKNYKEDDLFDAETSIRYGTYYLGKLKKDFNGDIDAMLAAYNGGEGNVRKWMAENNGDLIADEIPFIQTKNYVKSIKRDYKIYDYLYSQK